MSLLDCDRASRGIPVLGWGGVGTGRVYVPGRGMNHDDLHPALLPPPAPSPQAPPPALPAALDLTTVPLVCAHLCVRARVFMQEEY